MNRLTHINEKGEAEMVDISDKTDTVREAVVSGKISMQASTLEMIIAGTHKKGDVLSTARIAGIQAAKRCWDLIPLCHPIPLTSVRIDLVPYEQELEQGIAIQASCKTVAPTGVEMEAMAAASVAALTIYDMCKAVDRRMIIAEIALEEKRGGRSGHWRKQTHD